MPKGVRILLGYLEIEGEFEWLAQLVCRCSHATW